MPLPACLYPAPGPRRDVADPSKSELFAIKLPKNEKDAMAYTAAETGKTLTKVFYRAIQNTIHQELGMVLLAKLGRSRQEVEVLASEHDGKERERDRDKEPEGRPHFVRRDAPAIVSDFAHLMEQKDTKRAFHTIFEGVQFAEKEWLLYEVDLHTLAKELGQRYLEEDGGFDPVDLSLAKFLFFDYMIRATYDLTAMGLLKTLEDRWRAEKARIERLRDQLIHQYEERFERPVEVEVVEVLGEGRRGRRSDAGGR